MVREIPLTRGQVALVDDEDFAAVSAFHWHAKQDKRTWYARRNVVRDGGHTTELLHQFLLGRAVRRVDHIDGDGLNCQRANMRAATDRQNAHNRRRRRDSRQPFKGIQPHPKGPGWRARITFGGKRIYSRKFGTAAEAARWYDAMAREHFGPFAHCNFPSDS